MSEKKPPGVEVEKNQPMVIWVLVCKEHGKRRFAFSLDGPPSPAYKKFVEAK